MCPPSALRILSWVAPITFAIAACSSFDASDVQASDDGGADSGPPVIDDDAGAIADAAKGDAAAASDGRNAYGVAYPTKNIGYRMRTATSLGSVVPNLQFAGYALGAFSQSTVELADVFDPEGRTHDIVAIVLTGAWDPFSKATMDNLKAAPPKRVALVVALGEGMEPSKPATVQDLASWWNQTYMPAWYVHDPAFVQLASFNENVLPEIVVLDARTMEIVSASAGMPSNPTATLEAAAAAVKARPPSY